MFCSWKPHPTASCSCAYRLQSPIDELLNHLCCLGKGTFILRRPGLSVAKSTHFGLHLRNGPENRTVLHDAISGLETHLDRPMHAYLLREFPDQCPLFAIGPPGQPTEFTVRLDGHSWGSADILKMIGKFDGIALNCVESHRLGAGAWLDEWEQSKRRTACPASGVIGRTRKDLSECLLLEVAIRTSGHRSEVGFLPSFIDTEGTVLRIADKRRDHIIYADTGTPGFQLERTGSRSLRLSHHV